METIKHSVDFCVVGGGLAGLCAAVSAARMGAKVALMQERPVLGGNASSEIRMWVCGAHGPNNRETGIVEEIRLANLYRNPTGCWPIWDSVLYEKAAFEPNLTLILNCSCNDARMDGTRIRSVIGWQMTTQTWIEVEAALFADCSGDSILAPLSGAEFRWGRESSAEFGEDIAPAEADRRTMGMSCLLQLRETDRPQPFTPPSWAHVFATDEELQNRGHDMKQWHTNFWWIEVGGEGDSIRDSEQRRDELLKIAFGIWDHMKNRGDHGADNWVLDWIGFLPGKRESRRYVGDHIITQNDVRAGGPFEDVAAFGGWSMDDHHPSGFWFKGAPTIFHPAPSPYGIPYRSFYSRNIGNLFCAGRNISATHAAMSSTRVMATCGTIGQAVGTAAAIAAKHGTDPRGVYERHLAEFQDSLQDADCFLPGRKRTVARISREAELVADAGNPEALRNGWDRPDASNDNAWEAAFGSSATYRFAKPEKVDAIRIAFDSNLTNERPCLPCSYPLHPEPFVLPKMLVRGYRVTATLEDGSETVLREERNNIERLVKIPVGRALRSVHLTPQSVWGDGATARVYAFEAK